MIVPSLVPGSVGVFDAAMFRALPLLLLAGCAVAPAELPDVADVRWFTVSPGGTASAFAVREERLSYLHFGGRRFGPYP